VISRQQHPLAFTSFKVWLGGNIVGASIFLWESQEVLLRRQEGDTFVALPLLILIAIYGFIHFLALSAAVVFAAESRSWCQRQLKTDPPCDDRQSKSDPPLGTVGIKLMPFS
jgi:hypothetical protein